jgi:hypothetical protein
MNERNHLATKWYGEDVVMCLSDPSQQVVIAKACSLNPTETARRIAAALDAVEGVSTSALESGAVRELIDAAEDLVRAEDEDSMANAVVAVERLRAAVAKVRQP